MARLLMAALVLSSVEARAQSVVRGPYLQQGTPTSVIVVWRTNSPTTPRVDFGTDPAALTSVTPGGRPPSPRCWSRVWSRIPSISTRWGRTGGC